MKLELRTDDCPPPLCSVYARCGHGKDAPHTGPRTPTFGLIRGTVLGDVTAHLLGPGWQRNPARVPVVPSGAGAGRPSRRWMPRRSRFPECPHFRFCAFHPGQGAQGGRQAGSAASTGHHFEPRRHFCGGVHSGSPRLSSPGAESLKGTSGAQVGGELTRVVASGRLPCDAPVREAEAGSRGPQVASVLRVGACSAGGEVLGALHHGP